MNIKIKRVYEPQAAPDGFRILVDRLWPRGIKKEEAHLDLWLKDIAPSATLRKWFNHEADKWPEFIRKYKEELTQSGMMHDLIRLARAHHTVTLLYGAKDEKHNQAVALQSFLKTAL